MEKKERLDKMIDAHMRSKRRKSGIDEEYIRFIVRDEMEKIMSKPKKGMWDEARKKHPNAGKKWTKALDKQLVDWADAGSEFEVVCKEMGRSPGSIAVRARRLGVLDNFEGVPERYKEGLQ